MKVLRDNEARKKQLLLGKDRNLEHELDGTEGTLEEEVPGRENIPRLTG